MGGYDGDAIIEAELVESDAPELVENTCGDCIYFTGEECNGKFEGSETYSYSVACDEHDTGIDYDVGN